MTLEDLGFNSFFEKYIIDNNLKHFDIGRVIAEHKELYIIKTLKGDFEAEITGNLRYTAKGREDYPAVGDWVLITVYDNNFALIHKILPRYSIIKRRTPGKLSDIQVIATNIDYSFIVQSVDRDFNINRLERYLAICNSAKIIPIIILSKIDLISELELENIINKIKSRITDVPIIPISNKTKDGYDKLKAIIKKGKTYCVLGSSGVGKSTLINTLYGDQIMQTETISESSKKGKHKTTHRELVILESGGILIDNPGMREVGLADINDGLELTFKNIFEISENCKFRDCSHTHEIGCAVIEAVNNGEIDKGAYENYLKMLKEKEFFESTVVERRKKEKDLSKIVKNYKKFLKKNKRK